MHYLGELMEILNELGNDEFEAHFGSVPSLVISVSNDAEQPVLVDTPSAGTPVVGETMRWDYQPELTEVGEVVSPWTLLAARSSAVVPVLKSDRNPFAGLITIGRAENNDIRLTSTQVSKVHAYLRQSQDEWIIKDNTSRNGTFVDNLRLEPERDSSIRVGQEIRFGDVRSLFLDCAGLISLCGIAR